MSGHDRLRSDGNDLPGIPVSVNRFYRLQQFFPQIGEPASDFGPLLFDVLPDELLSFQTIFNGLRRARDLPGEPDDEAEIGADSLLIQHLGDSADGERGPTALLLTAREGCKNAVLLAWIGAEGEPRSGDAQGCPEALERGDIWFGRTTLPAGNCLLRLA